MTRDQEVHVPAFKVNAVDTSGAGDAFIGCFSHYYVQSGDVEAALKKLSLPLSASQGKVRNHLIRVLNNLMNFLTLNE